MAKNKKKATWDDVQRQCGLDADTIRMARELGMSPRTVIANHASTRQEQWKAPTAEWIQKLYQKRFGKPKAARSEGHEHDGTA
jgi:hypothetical protein